MGQASSSTHRAGSTSRAVGDPSMADVAPPMTVWAPGAEGAWRSHLEYASLTASGNWAPPSTSSVGAAAIAPPPPGAQINLAMLPETTVSNTAFSNIVVISFHGWNFWDSDAPQKSKDIGVQAKRALEVALESIAVPGSLELHQVPLSGCSAFGAASPNDQTILSRVDRCLLEFFEQVELDSHAGAQQLRQSVLQRRGIAAPPGTSRIDLSAAQAIIVIGHSQGAVVAPILLAHLLQHGIIDPMRQPTVFLGMAGIQHGSMEYFTAMLSTRPATKELYEMSKPEAPIFADSYLPAMQILLQRGVVVVPVASFRDRVVSIASATTDGLHHPNIIRALYVNPRFLPPGKQPATSTWNLFSRTPHDAARDIALEIAVLAIHLRNCGYQTDLTRFCVNKSSTAITTGVGKTAAELLSAGWGVLSKAHEATTTIPATPTPSPGSVATGARAVGVAAAAPAATAPVTPAPAAAPTSMFQSLTRIVSAGMSAINESQLQNTSSLVSDANTHSEIVTEPEVYRFGFLCLLWRWNYLLERGTPTVTAPGRPPVVLLEPPSFRASFDTEPLYSDQQHLQRIFAFIQSLPPDSASLNELRTRLAGILAAIAAYHREQQAVDAAALAGAPVPTTSTAPAAAGGSPAPLQGGQILAELRTLIHPFLYDTLLATATALPSVPARPSA